MKKMIKPSAVITTSVAALMLLGAAPAFAKAPAPTIASNSKVIKTANTGTKVWLGGSSFDYPFVSAVESAYTQNLNNASWFDAYSSLNSLKGREAAINSAYGNTDNASNIGFTDVPLTFDAAASPTDASLLNNAGYSISDFVEIPITVGGIGIIYNLPSFTGANAATCQTDATKYGVILSAAALAGIFNPSPTITNWNNATILALNPKLVVKTGTKKAPVVDHCLSDFASEAITPEVRTLDSGTSWMFSNYLHTADSAAWPSVIDMGNSSGNANSGALSTAVSATNGSIGYVEASYALINKLPTAKINDNGKAITLSAKSVAADAKAAFTKIGSNFGADSLADFTLADAGSGYPIVGVSWAVVLKNQTNMNQAIAEAKFLEYLTNASKGFGQSLASLNGYIPLPASLSAHDQTVIGTINVGGVSALSATN